MSVRAKFKFESYRTSLHARYPHKDANGKADYGRPETQELRTLEFSPVYSDNPNSENRLFWEATPSGKLELGTVNAEAWSQFELGKEYYLDFTLAE